MGDIDDRDPRGFQLFDHLEHDADLGLAEGGGGFIHDQDAHVLSQGAGNRDDLLLAQPQVTDQGIRIHGMFEALEQFFRSPLFFGVVKPDPVFQLAGHEDVIGDGEIGEKIQLLVDDADAVLRGLDRVAEAHRLAFQEEQAIRRAFDTGEDLHQSRLSGAVFTHQDVHLAPIGIEGHVAQRDGSRENLGDVQGAQNHVFTGMELILGLRSGGICDRKVAHLTSK